MVRRTEKGVRRTEKRVRRTEKGVRRTEKWVQRTEIVLWGHRTSRVFNPPAKLQPIPPMGLLFSEDLYGHCWPVTQNPRRI